MVELHGKDYGLALALELKSMSVQESEPYHGHRDMIDAMNRSLRQINANGTLVDYWSHNFIREMLQNNVIAESRKDLSSIPERCSKVSCLKNMISLVTGSSSKQ